MIPVFEFERGAAARGFRTIAGVDEVGRGPLAGPVTAAVGSTSTRDGCCPDTLIISRSMSSQPTRNSSPPTRPISPAILAPPG